MNLVGLFFCVVAVILFGFIYKKERKNLALYVLAVVFFLPKINILTLTDEAVAGFRTDDFIIFLFMIVMLMENFRTTKEVFKSNIFKIYLLYLISSTISYIVGIVTGQTFYFKLSFFSLIRKVEYFCFIFVGYDFIFHNKKDYQKAFNNLLYAFTTFTAILSLLQYTDLIGSYRSSKYELLGVATGTFNGPYEIGGLFTIFFAYYFYNFMKNKDRKINIYYSVVSILIVLLSKSRTSLVIVFFIIIVMSFIYCSKKQKIIITISCSSIFVIFIVLVSYNCLPLLDRFTTLDFGAGVDAIKHYVNNVTYEQYADIVKNKAGVEPFAYKYGDFSFNVRMFKWVAVLKGFSRNILFGYGFGSNTTLDGNYVKLLVENGVIGTILFISALAYTNKYRKNNNIAAFVVWIIVSQLIGAIFIDILEASKIMEFLWFVVGISLLKLDENSIKISNKNDWLFQEQFNRNEILKKEGERL